MSDDIYLLNQEAVFPPAEQALTDPDGLLAVGGDLSAARLIEAYRHGIFPWYCEDEPILWWSPDPRCVFDLNHDKPVRISKSLARTLKSNKYKIHINQNFKEVISSCSLPRAKQPETWILPEMQLAYSQLYQLGIAHSVEVYNLEDELVGGLYGISLGKFFFGESMFSRQNDASKIALVHLADYLKQAGFVLIDCQIPNDHLYSLGAIDISRQSFLSCLEQHRDWQQPAELWKSKELSLSDNFALRQPNKKGSHIK